MTAETKTPLSPVDVVIAPELAALAIIDDAIDLALFALVAAQPPLVAEPPPYWVRDAHTPAMRIARALQRRAAQLQQLLRAYHAAVLAEAQDRGDQPLPF